MGCSTRPRDAIRVSMFGRMGAAVPEDFPKAELLSDVVQADVIGAESSTTMDSIEAKVTAKSLDMSAKVTAKSLDMSDQAESYTSSESVKVVSASNIAMRIKAIKSAASFRRPEVIQENGETEDTIAPKTTSSKSVRIAMQPSDTSAPDRQNGKDHKSSVPHMLWDRNNLFATSSMSSSGSSIRSSASSALVSGQSSVLSSYEQTWRKCGPSQSEHSHRYSLFGAQSNAPSDVSTAKSQITSHKSRPLVGLYSRSMKADSHRYGDEVSRRNSHMPMEFRPQWFGEDQAALVSTWRWFLRLGMESWRVQTFIVVLVCVDLVLSLIALSTDWDSPKAIEVIILTILCMDIFCRIIAEGCGFFTKKGRAINIFEMFVVVLCMVFFLIEASFAKQSKALRFLGRLIRVCRPIVMAVQQRSRFMRTVKRKVTRKAFNILIRLLGDLVRVKSESIFVDPVEGTFRMNCAEIRTETFEDLHLPATVTGGFVQHLRISLPLLDNRSDALIKIQAVVCKQSISS